MSTVKKTISLPETLYQKALRRTAEEDFATFSDYIQALIREDSKNLVKTELDNIYAELQWNEEPVRRSELLTRKKELEDEPKKGLEPVSYLKNQARQRAAGIVNKAAAGIHGKKSQPQ